LGITSNKRQFLGYEEWPIVGRINAVIVDFDSAKAPGRFATPDLRYAEQEDIANVRPSISRKIQQVDSFPVLLEFDSYKGVAAVFPQRPNLRRQRDSGSFESNWN
jgi:hypothetical protein